ncbi:hypothetical protein [Streptomyces marincola]|uniref:Uncharacterized protein n=1 Tax=Streptomyces marincola TaxID=2878388 RepID=A0A1W7D4U6_9ACTN|nr:hypothetical protein [Streptomyces marincola]ARQ72034.1 hypothetical protein CAG99_27250 [Streptomyces marincola]
MTRPDALPPRTPFGGAAILPPGRGRDALHRCHSFRAPQAVTRFGARAGERAIAVNCPAPARMRAACFSRRVGALS